VVQGLNAPYTITRCFNSYLTGAAATTPPCGFNLTEVQPGLFNIDFGFQMNDRFIMATLINSSSACTLYAAYTPDVETSGQLLCGFGGSYTPFVGTVAVF
jgi:hypothetical protein